MTKPTRYMFDLTPVGPGRTIDDALHDRKKCTSHHYACDCREERFEAMRMALELIATARRPDGTWNRDREACRQIALRALEGAK